MERLLALSGVALFALACPGGTQPKPAAREYRAHGEAGGAAFGAEYLVRSIPGGREMHFTGGYLVVEVAVYPGKGQPLMVAHSHFTLRLNGRKQVLFAQSPGMVAASLKYPDWEHRPSLTGTAGTGDAGVIIGRPRSSERFPGDPRPGQERLPRPPRAPDAGPPGGIEREERQPPHEAAIAAALPEGEAALPVSGVLYFAYRGKTTAIRKAELVYKGPAGSLTLRLLD